MAKRDDIIDAALDIVCNEGIRALTLPLLFKSAHTGAGTFYHYFSGRDELIDAVFDTCCSTATSELSSVEEQGATPRECFFYLCSAMFDGYRRHPRETTFLYIYAYGYAEPGEQRERVIPSLTLLESYLSDAKGKGALPESVNAPVAARVIRGAIASIYWSYQHGLCGIDEVSARVFAERTWNAMACR